MVLYSLATVAQRRHAVEWVLNVTADTALAPGRYERQLLARFEQGELPLDEMIGLLKAATYYLLYRSHATARPTAAELEDMLGQARVYNAAADVTGLLLYHDGRYVQVLEGPKGAVREVYARICRDPRHAHISTINEGLGPARRFPTRRMALGNMTRPAGTRMLAAAVASEPFHGVPFDDPLLNQLLEACGIESDHLLPEAA